MNSKARCSLLVLVGMALVRDAAADEGMWTFDNVPASQLEKQYGFLPTPEWLDRVRLGSVRLAQGCSASFVSANGLVMTNHHCAVDCIEQLSTKAKDFVKGGFYAKTSAEERRCPDLEANQLTKITDVTQRMLDATKGLDGAAFAEKLKAEKTKIEGECTGGESVRCEVVTLYQGGRYHLYQYKRYQDVRLVFAPEMAAAFFGGDPDNFNFPRYALDVSFVRVYDGGKPLATKDFFFPFAKEPLKEGDLTFVSGNPGETSRELTVAELELQRDLHIPMRLVRLSEMRGVLTQFADRGAEQRRVSTSWLFGIENSYKAWWGSHRALLEPTTMEAKRKAESELRAAITKDAKKKVTLAGDPWADIAKAMDAYRTIYSRYQMLEVGRGFGSELFNHARALVRFAEETVKPNELRLREYTDAAWPEAKQSLLAKAPLSDELEIVLLTFGLTKLREDLGPDDALVQKVLGKDSPAALARKLVKGSMLKNAGLREKLVKGGKAAIDASKDPLLALARLVDAESRAVRKAYEDGVESVIERAHEQIAKARFALHGTSVYPDATFTLRLSIGQVKGWTEPGRTVAPFTTFAGAFARHTGQEPFQLPKSWLAAQKKLALDTPLDFATTNDIIGGNSGSPVVDREARIVGLIFDGNIHSLGGDYFFDPRLNRSVAVSALGIVEALDKIYGARRLLDELAGSSLR